jgi:hypothetical protein
MGADAVELEELALEIELAGIAAAANEPSITSSSLTSPLIRSCSL